jgi:hypothetical protein
MRRHTVARRRLPMGEMGEGETSHRLKTGYARGGADQEGANCEAKTREFWQRRTVRHHFPAGHG